MAEFPTDPMMAKALCGSEKYKCTNEQSSFQNSMDNSNTKSLHSNRDIDNKFDNVLISPSKANARLLKKTKSMQRDISPNCEVLESPNV